MRNERILGAYGEMHIEAYVILKRMYPLIESIRRPIRDGEIVLPKKYKEYLEPFLYPSKIRSSFGREIQVLKEFKPQVLLIEGYVSLGRQERDLEMYADLMRILSKLRDYGFDFLYRQLMKGLREEMIEQRKRIKKEAKKRKIRVVYATIPGIHTIPSDIIAKGEKLRKTQGPYHGIDRIVERDSSKHWREFYETTMAQHSLAEYYMSTGRVMLVCGAGHLERGSILRKILKGKLKDKFRILK